jgi:putative serine protease PepD
MPRTQLPRWWWPTSVAIAAVLGCAVGGLIVIASEDDAEPTACVATTVARDVLPSVVTIAVTEPSGADGYILTNEHVIDAAVSGRASITVHYSDGRTSPASVVGADFTTDLAVIRAEDGADGRPLLPTGDSDDVVVGHPVVALGAPLGLSNTLTAGIVSALGRYVPIPADTGRVAHLLDAIQTDAAINPGNSGGPLVDCDGAQVGVNSAISTVPNSEGVGGGGSVGLGFAIPMSIATPIADQLIESGQVDHPVLGLAARTVAEDPAGLQVTAVVPGGPAAAAGLQVGDVITEIDGQAADNTEQLVLVSLRHEAGDAVPVTYTRDGAIRTAEITLAAPR